MLRRRIALLIQLKRLLSNKKSREEKEATKARTLQFRLSEAEKRDGARKSRKASRQRELESYADRVRFFDRSCRSSETEKE